MRWVLFELLCAFGSTTGKRVTELPSLVFLSKQGAGMSTEPPPKCGKKTFFNQQVQCFHNFHVIVGDKIYTVFALDL